MSAFRDISIRWKVALIIMLNSVVLLLLYTGVFIIHNRSEFYQRVTYYAGIMGILLLIALVMAFLLSFLLLRIIPRAISGPPVTARQSPEEGLKVAYEKLKELDQLKSDLVSSVSHELRTPLTSIIAFADILLSSDNVDDATRKEFLQIIKEDSERLNRLIGNVLDVSKIEAGMMQWEEEQFDVAEVVKKAIRSVKGLARAKEINIELGTGRGSYLIFADPDRIHQVVTNLLGNAVKFSPPKGRVTVNVFSKMARGKKWVQIAVGDQGEGIEKKYWEKIFKKFQQLGRADSTRFPGSGIGLPICREIVNHYGGEIRIRSEPGKGSIFSFTLLLCDERENEN